MISSNEEPQNSGTVYIPNNGQMTHEQLEELRKRLRKQYRNLFPDEEVKEEK